MSPTSPFPRRLMAGTAALAALMAFLPAWGAGSAPSGPAAPPPGGRAAGPAEATAPEPAGSKLDLSKALVIGASVSDGFGIRITLPLPAATEPTPAPAPSATPGTVRGAADQKTQPAERPAPPRPRSVAVSMADILGAIAEAPRGVPRAETSTMFFMDAPATGKRQVEAAGKNEPSVVFALDYLFWYVYGVMPEDQRLKLFEEGLANLAALGCPVVVGDIPDMSAAIGGMLSKAQVPEPATMAAANRRLAEWAAGRKNVVVIPLSALVRGAMSGQRVELGGRVFEGDDARALIQRDRLHATLKGTIAIAIEGLRRLREAGLVEKSATWSEDPAEIEARLVARKAPKPRDVRGTAPAPASDHPPGG